MKGGLLLALILLQTAVSPAVPFDLSKIARWSLSNVLGSNNVSLDAIAVPSYAIDVLYRQGILSRDPLYRFNERDYGWVANDTWTFTARWNFSSSANSSSYPSNASVSPPARRWLLTLSGVDSVADVLFNGNSLSFLSPERKIANAHRRHVFDVTAFLFENEENALDIVIFPAAQYTYHQATVYPYPVPHTRQLGSTGHYNFIRKAASDFGWDWGPNYAPAGLAGGADLASSASALLTDVGVRQQHHANGSVTVVADAYFRPMRREREVGALTIEVVRMLDNDDDISYGSTKRWKESIRVEIRVEEAFRAAAAVGEEGACREAASYFSCEFDAAPGDAHAEEGLRGRRKGAFPTGESAAWVVRRHVSMLLTPPLELWWPWDLDPSTAIHSTGKNYRHRRAFYNVTVSYVAEGDESGAAAVPPQNVHRRIGLRKVDLLRRRPPGSGKGESFEFAVNGVPFYARGANVVPLDAIESRVDEKKARAVVAAARAANMNMLRAWGGGRYLQDAFYDACDEAGILVWQEFAFACAMYPRDVPFLTDVAEEARQQTLRLNSHPCVAVWGGNNENEAALGWFPETAANEKLYAVDLDALFGRLLRRVLASADPEALYVDSSPSNGVFSAMERLHVKRWGDVGDPSYGDVHFYDYKSNLLDPDAFPPAKFVSEFGFMSYPSFPAYAAQTAAEDWAADSAMSAFRMRHANGLLELRSQLEMHFFCSREEMHSSQRGMQRQRCNNIKVAWNSTLSKRSAAADASTSSSSKEEEFRAFIYLTQVQQALIYETAASKWRRGKGDPQRTAGFLYWQLNDVWAGPSWSGLDFDGRWKALHYAARRFFSPVAVFGAVDGRSEITEQRRRWDASGSRILEVWLVNDGSASVEGLLSVEAVPFRATAAADVRFLVQNFSVLAPASGAAVAWASDLGDTEWGGVDAAARHVFLRLRFCPAVVSNTAAGENCSESMLLLAELKDVDLAPARLWVESVVEVHSSSSSTRENRKENSDLLPRLQSLELTERSGHSGSATRALMQAGDNVVGSTFEVTLRAEGGAAFHAFLESPSPGIFSNNLMVVLPWRTVRVVWRGEEGQRIGVRQFEESLSVTWMHGTAESGDNNNNNNKKSISNGFQSLHPTIPMLTISLRFFLCALSCF